jgi:succinate-acetate transporter protein
MCRWRMPTRLPAASESDFPGPLTVFVLLTAAFFALVIGDAATSTDGTHFGRRGGLLTAVAAWYASFAGVTNFTFGRTVLPSAPR